MKFLAYLLSEDGVLTATIGSSTYIVNDSHMNYAGLINAFKKRDADEFLRLYNVTSSINDKFAGSGVEVIGGEVYFRGERVTNKVCDRIIRAVRSGHPVQYLVNFLEKLLENPSFNSQEQGFEFLSHKNLPICEDGDFIAYKTVRSNYMDKYTGTIDNSIGETIDWRHKRHLISDDPNKHCAQGLHVGALSYAGPGGWYNGLDDKVVLVKVNPRDMVSVPNDHGFTKMRVCRYEVIGDYVAPLNSTVYRSHADDIVEDDYDDYDDYEDDVDYDCDLDDLFDDAISLDEVEFGDHVEFNYINTDGVKEKRYLEVDEYRHGVLHGRITKGDPSYQVGGGVQYRNFKKDYLDDLRLILN
jgi:hypothetical protein